MSTLFQEQATAPTKVGNNWRAILITPGRGSSGTYTESMLKEYGPQAFPKGTHCYVDHPRDEDDVRSPKNLMGVLAEDAYYEAGVGLVAELTVMPHWKEFVESVAPHTGLSIYAMGEGVYDDKTDELVVENLIPHMQNSVDLVAYPGRPGSKLSDKLYEAARAMVVEEEEETSTPMGSEDGTAAKTVAATTLNKEEGYSNMELEELANMMAELPNLVAAAVVEALAPSGDPEEVKEEVDVAAVAEALVAAGLPEVSRKAVYESLRAGADLHESIESQKAFVESVKSHLKEESKDSPRVEESVIVNTEEKAPGLSSILNVKVGA